MLCSQRDFSSFQKRDFLSESVSDKNKQNHGQSHTKIGISEWVCFRTPNNDLEWSILRGQITAGCSTTACHFFRRVLTHFSIRNSWFSCNMNISLVFLEKITEKMHFSTIRLWLRLWLRLRLRPRLRQVYKYWYCLVMQMLFLFKNVNSITFLLRNMKPAFR